MAGSLSVMCIPKMIYGQPWLTTDFKILFPDKKRKANFISIIMIQLDTTKDTKQDNVV